MPKQERPRPDIPPRGVRPEVVTTARGRAAPRPPSIDDVAEAAGVSTATVSRFLNTPGVVAAETAARIKDTIARLGYRPNRFAQGLMTRRSHVIGIVLPDIHGEFYSELLRGACGEARTRGYHLLVAGADLSEESAESIRAGPFGLIDGLAVMMTEPNAPLWDAARSTGLPVVTLDADQGDDTIPAVLIDNASGAAEATAHLLAGAAPEACWFVGGPADNFDSRQRAAAFSACLRQAGHAVRPEQVAFGTYAAEWGRAWAAQWLARRGGSAAGPAGILAGNDEIALGIVDALREAGTDIPAAARVVGFDDSRLASLLRPPLSSVRVPRAEVGAAAIAALVERLENPGIKVASRTLPTRLIVRDSSRA